MGTWNETCLLSRLPIKPEDEVVLFLAKRSTAEDFARRQGKENSYLSGSGVHTPFAFFELLSLPITGIYDDYGMYIISDYHELSLNDVIKERRSSTSLYPEDVDKVSVCYIPILKEVYEEILKEYNSRENPFSSNMTNLEFYKYGLKNILFSERELTIEEELIVTKIDMHLPKLKFLMNDMYFPELTIDEIFDKKTISLFSETILFSEILECERVLFIPQSGSGSSKSEYSLAKIVGKIASKKQP